MERYGTPWLRSRIKGDLGIPPEEEIKWKPDRAKSPVFASFDGNLVAQVRCRMLEEAIRRQIRTVVVIVDHHRALQDCSEAQAGMQILKWLYDTAVVDRDLG